jgi:hypothetical protein
MKTNSCQAQAEHTRAKQDLIVEKPLLGIRAICEYEDSIIAEMKLKGVFVVFA